MALHSSDQPPAVQPADFQSAPQALGGRADAPMSSRKCRVSAIALAAHRRSHIVARKRALKLMAAILASPIRMKDQPRLWPTPEPRHAQRNRHDAGLHVLSHALTHQLATEQIKHCRQIQPTLIGGDVGDVAAPHLVGRLGREVAHQQVRRNGKIVFLSVVMTNFLLPLALMLERCISRLTRSLPTRMPRLPAL